MNAPQHTARRATLDDLPGLRGLWQVEQLTELELDKRVPEFQVVLDAEGQVVGALALQISGLHGHLHSEAFKDFAQADVLRPLLWERIQTVARNRGMVRLWTRETTSFWRGVDFQAPAPEILEKLPGMFGGPDDAWSTLKLKDELLANLSPEQEFALFKDAIKAESDAALRQARILKGIATAVALLFFIMVIVGGVYIWRYKNYTDRYGMPPQLPPSQKATPPPAPNKK